MREIVFDTETTGLDPKTGDRMVEIGCIELINRFPSGKTFHRYFNPQRDMPEGAFYIYADAGRFTNDSLAFCARMLSDAGVAATPGLDFDRQRGSRTVRFSYAGTPQDIGEAIARSEQWLPTF